VANALWCQKDFPFRTDFLSLVKDQYQADLSLLDFIKDPEGGRKEINRWVEDKTRRKIRELIQPGQVEPHTKFVVTNAIYLNKSWETRFPKKLTREESFDTGKGEKQVWMMRGHLAKPYHKAEGVQLLQLPYEDGRLAMLIVLPDAGQDLKKFEQDLTWPKLSKWIANLKRSGVDVSLPRVQAVESRNHLAQILIAMGMRRSFTSQADFSGMISDKEIQLKDVIHQALLSVDENETEAAGATAIVGIELVSSPSQSLPTFRADRPFLIFLRDTHSGAILFTGRVTNP
jgi:serpin B